MSAKIKSTNDAILKAFDKIVMNAESINKLGKYTADISDNVNLMAVKLLKLEKTVEALKNVKSS
jgi:predicted acylesterase/phospholipase RssA